MPRAFLITHRRYNGMEEFEEPVRDYSPERGVRIAEYNGCGQPTSDGVSDCGSETSSECPEELYNLTKLAEVSLAAAAGTLIHPGNVLYQQRPLSPRCAVEKYELPRSSPRQQQQHQRQTTEEDQGLLREKTRRFFERVETERDTIIDRRSPSTDLEVSPEDSLSTLNDVPRSSRIIEASTAKRPAPLQADITKPAEDPEVHECPDCGKKYSTSSNLARHRQTHRSLGDKKARRCPHCDKVYVSMPAYSMHVRTHNQGCKCHYCGKCFSRPWLLQGHIRTHTGEKPFKCTICSKAFADKSNLRAHIQTHSNTKPHVCGRCGKAFALKSYLYKHEESSCMRAHHRTSSESKPEKRETDLPILIGAGSKIVTNRVVASPTSVIVPRLGHGASAREPSLPSSSPSPSFPTIRHAAADDSPTKRQCRVRPTEKSSESVTTTTTMTTTTTTTKDSTSYLSQMVIRTSVISPNPEHLGRFAVANGKKSAGPFDFEDPTRSSAFSRPTGMTLNLAIA